MATKKKTQEGKDAPTFEQSLVELEEIVAKLEGGDIALEESLEAFERGVKMVRGLHKRLDEVQEKIEELSRSQDGRVKTEALEEE
ncbi:MAG: exodeoxyribonuclease VII small subunit [Deltaproteobacteria bacterium]|jgi:exodeoxyribonuclease VII small subunit